MPTGEKFEEKSNMDGDDVRVVSHIVEIDGEKYWIKAMNNLHKDEYGDEVFTGENNPLPVKESELRSKVSQIETDIGVIKDDISQLKDDISSLKTATVEGSG